MGYGIAPDVEAYIDTLNQRQLQELNHIGKINYRVYSTRYLPGMQPIDGDRRTLADLRHSLKIYACHTPKWDSVEALKAELARPNTHWTFTERRRHEPYQTMVR